MPLLNIFKKKKERKEKKKEKEGEEKGRLAKPAKENTEKINIKEAVKSKGKRIVEKEKKETKGKARKKEPNAKKKEKLIEETPLAKKRKPYPFAYRILKSPHITEKATLLAGRNKYVFRTYPKANKTEIKKAVESIYNVEVVSVRTIHIPSKKKRLMAQEGRKSGYKKAIVTLKRGFSS